MGLRIEFNYLANDSINHAYAMKPQLKTSDTKALVRFLMEEQIKVPGRHCLLILRREQWKKLCVQDPSRPCPICLFIWLVLICIIYNKTVNISAFLSSVGHFRELSNLRGL